MPMIIGYHSTPRGKMYWENLSDIQHPLISNAKRRDRFKAIFIYTLLAMPTDKLIICSTKSDH